MQLKPNSLDLRLIYCPLHMISGSKHYEIIISVQDTLDKSFLINFQQHFFQCKIDHFHRFSSYIHRQKN